VAVTPRALHAASNEPFERCKAGLVVGLHGAEFRTERNRRVVDGCKHVLRGHRAAKHWRVEPLFGTNCGQEAQGLAHAQ
jgi:hypothetical protein